MSQLEDFFSEPIESEQTMGLEQAFSQEPEPTMGLEQAFSEPMEDSNSTEPLSNVVSVVRENDVIDDKYVDEMIALYEGVAEQEKDSIIQIKSNMKTQEEYASDAQTEVNKDLTQDTLSSMSAAAAAFKATPGPLPVKTGASVLAGIAGPDAVRGFQDNGIKGAAEGVGKRFGVNEPQNIKDNLEARRSALGKATAIKPTPKTTSYQNLVQGIRN